MNTSKYNILYKSTPHGVDTWTAHYEGKPFSVGRFGWIQMSLESAKAAIEEHKGLIKRLEEAPQEVQTWLDETGEEVKPYFLKEDIEAPKTRRIPEDVITGLAAITGAALALFIVFYLFFG